jgi:hypothetical protein
MGSHTRCRQVKAENQQGYLQQWNRFTHNLQVKKGQGSARISAAMEQLHPHTAGKERPEQVSKDICSNGTAHTRCRWKRDRTGSARISAALQQCNGFTHILQARIGQVRVSNDICSNRTASRTCCRQGSAKISAAMQPVYTHPTGRERPGQGQQE